jgi:hypothetical protein
VGRVDLDGRVLLRHVAFLIVVVFEYLIVVVLRRQVC